MFSLLIPNISQYRFIKRLSLARNDYFANKQFYETFWKVCFVLSFLFTSLFFIKAGNIPMLASNPEIARVEAMKGSGIIQRFSYLTLHFGVITYFIIEYFKGHKHINKKILILIIALVFYNILTGPRSYALWTFILIYIVYQLLNYKKLKILHGILLLIFILTLIAVIGGVRYSGLSDVNFSDTIIRFVNRIYMNPVNANRIVEFFYNKPIETNSFLIEISVLLPGYQPDLGTYLKNLFGITFEGGGITVPLPAEGYMNFGYIGVVLYSFIFVLVLKLFELFIYIFRASVFNILFIILIPIQFMGVITMGLSGILVKTTIPVIIVFLTVLTVVKFIINIRKKYSIKVKYDVKTIK
jgi:oligosaccharide repeat unit polymerase